MSCVQREMIRDDGVVSNHLSCVQCTTYVKNECTYLNVLARIDCVSVSWIFRLPRMDANVYTTLMALYVIMPSTTIPT